MIKSERFRYAARVVVKSERQYRRAVESAHPSWGHDPSRKHNALFLVPELRATSVIASLPPLSKELEEVSFGPGAIFWSASKARITATTMMKVAKLDVYKRMTVRNHKTTWKLLELLDE